MELTAELEGCGEEEDVLRWIYEEEEGGNEDVGDVVIWI